MNVFNIQKTFELKEQRKWPEIYICIDLHGTIIPNGKSTSDISDELVFYPDAKEVLQWMTKRKDIFLILWTSTPLTRIDKIWEFFTAHNIQFDYINSNSHAKNTPRSDFSKKFYFNILLDDRAGFVGDTDWTLIKKELTLIKEWDRL
jgi:hypothetical protein